MSECRWWRGRPRRARALSGRVQAGDSRPATSKHRWLRASSLAAASCGTAWSRSRSVVVRCRPRRSTSRCARRYRPFDAQRGGNKRTLAFVAVTAEEKGVLGSCYFAARPSFRSGSVVADLNTDMLVSLFAMNGVFAYGYEESDLADDLSQPIDFAAAAAFNAFYADLALRVANRATRPAWRANSFLRRRCSRRKGAMTHRLLRGQRPVCLRSIADLRT